MIQKVIIMGLLSCIICGCTAPQPMPKDNYAELSFGISQSQFASLKKGSGDDVPACSDLSMDYATFTLEVINQAGILLSTQDYKTDIFYANGKYVTQPIKLSIDQNGSVLVRITSFLVFHNNASAEDVIVRAAPLEGSSFFDFVNNKLGTAFSISKFAKKEQPIDVLCFEPAFYENFGFTWVNLNLVTIRSQCWFGDICTDDTTPFNGSIYEDQSAGLQFDMPAIMKVNVLKYVGGADGNVEDDLNWKLLITHGNSDYFGEGDCLVVTWPDNDDLDDLFRFDLYVLLPVATLNGNYEMKYVFQKSYSFYNNLAPDTGSDGVFDFIIGDCTNIDIDGELPPEIGNGCTLTQGFWKTHTGINKKTNHYYWGDINPNDEFLESGLSYIEVFAHKPSESKYFILAHQWLAAMLNQEVGGVDLSPYPDLLLQFQEAEQLLRAISDRSNIGAEQEASLIQYAETLDLFNNGQLGPGHCK